MAGGGIEGLISGGGAFASQFAWTVESAVAQAALGPALAELTQKLNADHPLIPLAPADLADLVVRNYLPADTASATAAKSGVSADDFALLVRNAGAAPDTTTLIEAYRRRIIGWDTSTGGLPSVLDGIREGRLADKWAPMLRDLGDLPIGVADAVDAVVENQISRSQGETIAYEQGISAANFAILVNTRGNPPGPAELADLVRRGVIPQGGTGPDVLSFVQGISEGATKDKWIPALTALQTVLPPEGRVTAMLRAGAITEQQALHYYRQLGYDQTVAQGFATEASHAKTATAKDLAKGDIERLYADGAIDAPTATGMLATLGYTADEAGYLLAIQDMHAATVVMDSVITRIRSYYVARKISLGQVVTALDSLGVPTAQRDKLTAAWQIARTSNVKLLTESQVVDAWAYKIMTTDQAMSALQALGYTALDAWTVLSIKNKGPLPGQPAPGPAPLT